MNYEGQGAQPRRVPPPQGVKRGVDLRAGTAARAKEGVSLRERNRSERLWRLRQHEEPALLVPRQEDPAAGAEQLPGPSPSPSSPSSSASQPTGHALLPFDDPWRYNYCTRPEDVPVELLPTFAKQAFSREDRTRYHGVLMLRKLLAVEARPVPVDAVVDYDGLLVHLVDMTGEANDGWPELQQEAMWVLANITGSAQRYCFAVVRAMGAAAAIRLLTSHNEQLRMQAMSTVGNLAGETVDLRTYLLQLRAMPMLVEGLAMPASLPNVTRRGAWALSCLCRSPPSLPLVEAARAIPSIAGLLCHHDEAVQIDACWCAQYVTDGPVEHVDRVLRHGDVLDHLIRHATSDASPELVLPALRAIGNMVAKGESQADVVLSRGFAPMLRALLRHPHTAVRQEGHWCAANFAAGAKHIDVLCEHGIFPVLIASIWVGSTKPQQQQQPPPPQRLVTTTTTSTSTTATSSSWSPSSSTTNNTHVQPPLVKKEAVYAVANTCSNGTEEQVMQLVEDGVVPALIEGVLNRRSGVASQVMAVAIEALGDILSVGAGMQERRGAHTNPIQAEMTACDGWEELQDLADVLNVDLYHVLQSLLAEHCPAEEAAPMPTSGFFAPTSTIVAAADPMREGPEPDEEQASIAIHTSTTTHHHNGLAHEHPRSHHHHNGEDEQQQQQPSDFAAPQVYDRDAAQDALEQQQRDQRGDDEDDVAEVARDSWW